MSTECPQPSRLVERMGSTAGPTESSRPHLSPKYGCGTLRLVFRLLPEHRSRRKYPELEAAPGDGVRLTDARRGQWEESARRGGRTLTELLALELGQR